MNSSILFTVGLFLSSISNTTCLIPDDYNLTITVKTNNTYVVSYKGDVYFAPAVNAIVNGNYDEYKDKEVEKIISEFETVEGIKEVQYLGGGRFYIDIKTTKDMGENYYFISEDLGFFQVWSVFDELRIEGIELSSEVKSELKSVDINMEGKLTVRCQSGIKVRNHNAKTKENKNSMVNYKWDLDLDTPIPEIRIEFKGNMQIDEDDTDNFVDTENTVELQGYRISYTGYTDNRNGTSTWYYSLSPGDNAKSDLDHWTLGLDEDHEVIDASDSYSGLIDTDRETDIYGITFDEKFKKNDDPISFYFTLNGQYELGLVPIAAEVGKDVEETVINGPTGLSLESEDDLVVDDNSVLLNGFLFTYNGYENNTDGSSIWKYTVTSTNDAEHDLTHWVLALDEGHKVIEASKSFNGSIKTDSQTGLYGIPFYENIKKNNDSEDFYFILDQQYESTDLKLACKSASNIEEGIIKGPSSISTNSPEETNEWISYGKTYYSGDVVSYEGKEYSCRQTHTTNGDTNWAPDKANSLWEILDDGDDNITEFLELVTFFDNTITAFYNNNGKYPRTWGDYAYSDLGLAPEDYKDVYYHNFEFVPRGSILNLRLEDGFTITVSTTSGENVTFSSKFNWNLIYDTVTNYWYYHSENPNKMIDIHSLIVSETN